MYTLMLYSLKVGACLAVFYLFFKLLLSRETFHRLNRIVVLAAMVLSSVLPLCVITVYRERPRSRNPNLSRGIRRRRPLSLREPPLRCYGRSGRYAAYCT